MATISANVQYKRGEHLVLDLTSYQLNYSTAMAWARDINQNAAIGQYIYIAESETIDGVEYPKGPYIVEAYGENAVLSPLAKSLAGSTDLDSAVATLKADVSTLQTNVGTKSTKEGEESTGLYKDIEDVNDRIDNINIPVKGVQVDGADLTPDANGKVNVVIPKVEVPVKGITVDGETIAPDTNGIVNIDLPEPEEVFAYEIAKLDTASEGAASSYQLKKIGKDGTTVAGVTIDIPKDMVVSSGTVRTASADEIAEDATLVADKLYIVLTLANATEDKLFIPADKLVDAYTGSTYITVSEQNEITLNVETLVTKLGDTFYTETEVNTLLESYATTKALSDAIGTKSTFGDGATEGSGLLKDISELEHEVELLDAAAIKTVKVDGEALTVEDGSVNIVIPVKGVQVDNTDVVGADGIAKITIPTVDVPVKGVQVNGTDLTPDADGKVNVEIPADLVQDVKVNGTSVVTDNVADIVVPILDVKNGETSLVNAETKVADLSGFTTREELVKKGTDETTGAETYEGLLDDRYVLSANYLTELDLKAILV